MFLEFRNNLGYYVISYILSAGIMVTAYNFYHTLAIDHQMIRQHVVRADGDRDTNI